MSVRELKTWLFQCDECNYTETIKALEQPQIPQEGWTVKTEVIDEPPWGNKRRVKHLCIPCSKKHNQ